MQTCEIEVWILVDEDGGAVADCDPSHLRDEYETDVGELDVTKAMRQIKVTLTVPLPKPIELTGTVPAEVSTGELKVA